MSFKMLRTSSIEQFRNNKNSSLQDYRYKKRSLDLSRNFMMPRLKQKFKDNPSSNMNISEDGGGRGVRSGGGGNLHDLNMKNHMNAQQQQQSLMQYSGLHSGRQNQMSSRGCNITSRESIDQKNIPEQSYLYFNCVSKRNHLKCIDDRSNEL